MSENDITTDGASRDDQLPDGGTTAEEGLFPVSGRWFLVGFYLFFAAWLAYMMWQVSQSDNPQYYLFPFVIGIPLFVLLAIKLFTVLFPALTERVMPDSDEGESEMFEGTKGTGSRTSKAEKERYELLMIGWIAVLPFIMYYVGMGWTLLGYTFAFTWFFTRDVGTAAKVTAIVVLFVYVLFIEILGLIIWEGTLGVVDPLKFAASRL